MTLTWSTESTPYLGSLPPAALASRRFHRLLARQYEMKRFSRRLLRDILLMYGSLLVGLVVVFVALHYLEYVDDFMDRGATAGFMFTAYYPFLVPSIIYLVSPLALFLATVWIISQRIERFEWMAVAMAGASEGARVLPMAGLGLVISFVMFGFNGWLVPRAHQHIVPLDEQYLGFSGSTSGAGRVERAAGEHAVITFGFFDRDRDRGYRATLLEFGGPEEGVVRRTYATEAVYSRGRWTFVDGVVWEFTPEVRRTTFTRRDTVLTIRPSDMLPTARDMQGMTLTEARRHVEFQARAGIPNVARAETYVWQLITYPFVHLIVVLLGHALAAITPLQGRTNTLGVSVLVAFMYLALLKIVEPMGAAGLVRPDLAVLIPHIIFVGVIVGIWFLSGWVRRRPLGHATHASSE